MKIFRFPVKYKLGGRTITAGASVTKNKTVEPTRTRKSRAATALALKVGKSTFGNVGYVRLTSPNLPSYRRLASVRKGKYAYTASQA